MREFSYINLLIGAVLSIPVAVFTVKKDMLKPSAAALAALMMTLITAFGGPWALLLLLFSYLSLAALDKLFGFGITKATNDVNKKVGARDFVQVLVNGLGGCIGVILYFITDDILWLTVYVCGIAESYGDSLSSDIGVLSKSKPFDICRIKRIEPGMSGGVTLLGTAAGLGGCVLLSALGMLCFGADLKIFALCALAAFLGCVFDSVLGSLLQAKYRCKVCGKATEKLLHCGERTEHTGGIKLLDNCAVNLLSNLFSCALCALFLI